MPTDVLDTVRRLLAKAAATPYEAEAMAFAAKAQALMTRHAIDDALLDAGPQDDIGVTQLAMADPYASARFSLLSAVAAANRCRAVYEPGLRAATLVGRELDRQHTELTFTSLLLQATGAMVRHGSVTDRRGVNRTRAFRHSFLVGYASEVGRRLDETNNDVVQAAEPGVLPVLSSLEDRVDLVTDDHFPHLRRRRPSVSSGRGLDAGIDAGRRADIGAQGVSQQPVLPRSEGAGPPR